MRLTSYLLIIAFLAALTPALALTDTDRLGMLWKAAHYEQAMQARHLRDGGLVSGGTTYPFPRKWEEEVDENAPYLTGAYLAALSFRYAVTKDPAAQQQAARCARSLRKLVAITGTPGYLARWYCPVGKTRPDAGWLEDAWRLSGNYRWLGNPSTDQYTGVLFGYSVYYELAADKTERQLAVKAVRDMVGRMLDADMRILDPQGKKTSWSDMNPATLQEPHYSITALQFLKAAYQITGERRFEDKYRELATKHKYLELAVKPPTDPEDNWNWSDDVMCFEAFYVTLRHERDPAIRAGLRHALDVSWQDVKKDGRHLFGIFYDALVPGARQSAAGLQELADFPADKIHARRDGRSDRPVPVWQRQPGWFDFMSDTYTRVQGFEQSGVDYLLAYWMARYHGLVG